MRRAARVGVCVALGLLAGRARAAENLTQLIVDVRALTQDAAAGSYSHFTDAQITNFLNQGQREILAGNHCLQQSLIFSLVPGTTYYPLPSNYTVIERLLIGAKMIQQVTPASQDSQSLGWEYASGYPNRYFINFSSRGLVGFAPWPATSTDTDTIKVDYDVQANDLVLGADYPYNGVNELQDYQHAIAYWASAIIETIDQQPQRAQTYITLYTAVGLQMKAKCRDLTNYRPGASATP